MFKRVKTIGLLGVGLLAMLGTKAEAHYVYANGRWYYHSVGCEVEIGSLPNPRDDVIVKCAVTTVEVEAKCSNGSITDPLSIEVLLTDQEELEAGQTEVEVIVDDDSLRSNSSIVSECGGIADDVLIRSMASTVTIQCVGPSATCGLLSLVPTSIAVAACTLPSACTLNICEDDDREYSCSSIVTHVN